MTLQTETARSRWGRRAGD